MLDSLFGPFYAARISIDPDGGMLIASDRQRMLIWGVLFCLLAATALSCWLFRYRRRVAMSVFVLSLLIPVVVMPSVRREYIHVLPHRIEMDNGHWFMQSTRTIELGDMQQITQTASEFRFAGYYVDRAAAWQLTRVDGQIEMHDLNGFFTAHRMVVAQYLRDRGLRVQRPLPDCRGACQESQSPTR